MEEIMEVTLPWVGRVTLPRGRLPGDFLAWQSKARLRMFETMTEHGANRVRAAPAHLPVLASIGEGMFPTNLATRGIGPLPKTPFLKKFTSQFKKARELADDTDFGASLENRVAAARRLYSKANHFDPYLLGGLEIFEGQTSKNLMSNPVASLLYTGEPPKYPSYQMNGIVTFVEEGNPYYDFLLAARELFALDSFHITQHRYPYGYIFHVIEVKDKTPFPRRK